MDSERVREHGIVGTVYFPDVPGERPGIIVVSGSDGGIPEAKAELFAEEGFVALALGYFNAEGLPKNLGNIPLEYFLKSIQWLKGQPRVDGGKIHLFGPSRGGELVLLLASIFPDEISSVIAVVPSCVTNGGLPDVYAPAWTFEGKPLPIAPPPTKEEVYKQLETHTTVNLCELFLEKMKDHEAFDQALINVENIVCPILLISGKDDKMWPASVYCDLIMQRLDRLGSKIFREHLCYEHVGHMINNPYGPVMTGSFKHPVTGLYYELGGETKAQEAACRDSWRKILNFLSKHS